MREFYPLRIVTDVPPGVPAGALGDPLEQQGQHRERHMGPDPQRREVVDRAQLQPALQPPPRFLHPLQMLVAERQVLSTQDIVVAVHHELAVQTFGGLDLGPVDLR